MCRGLAASRTDLISMCNSQVSGCGFETHAEQPVKLPCLYFHYQLLSMLHINSEDTRNNSSRYRERRNVTAAGRAIFVSRNFIVATIS